jgi:3-oxoacyl-[acyl-carrier-protein] synthase-3
LAIPSKPKRFKILATGVALPDRVLSNADLEKMVDTTDAWITERTGIKERRIAEEGTSSSDLGAGALASACRRAGVEPADLDAIVVATSTPDTLFPPTACWIQKHLGIRGMPAFDVSAGCTGFLDSLEVGASLVEAGTAHTVGVVGVELMTRIVDWTDRSTCVLFGDGAGAVVIRGTKEDTGFLASNWGADGKLAPILCQPAGGSRRPATMETVRNREHTLYMEGNAVFQHAVRSMVGAANKALEDAKLTPEDVKLLIPHQANSRILQATRERTGVPEDRLYSVVHRYGNISAASIPVALHDAREEGRLTDGDVVLLTAFGTGLTWAASVIRL